MGAAGEHSPLRGLRVLDLTRNVAGPYASMILAEYGADVVKVESPGLGDDTRAWGPPFWEGWSPVFVALNRNKRSLVLDLRDDSSRAVMERLVEGSDVLLESFRPGAMERLGFGPDWAAARNPGLVYCSITAYGDRGPLRDRPGYDPLMQAFAGIMSVTGEPDRPPVRVGVSLIDMGTGMWAANAILAALLERHESGRGRRLVTSLYETAIAWMSYHLAQYWASGEPPRAHGSGTSTIVPYQAFPTRDGHLVIGAANDALFARLARVLGHSEWLEDERFANNPARVANRDLVVAAVAEATGRWTAAELEPALREASVPCAVIRDAGDVAADEQAAALGIFQEPAGGPIPGFRSVGLPVTVDGDRPRLRRFPPSAGEHTAEVLAELGLQPAGSDHKQEE